MFVNLYFLTYYYYYYYHYHHSISLRFPMKATSFQPHQNWHLRINSTLAACTLNSLRCSSWRTRGLFSHAYVLAASETDQRVHACASIAPDPTCMRCDAGRYATGGHLRKIAWKRRWSPIEHLSPKGSATTHTSGSLVYRGTGDWSSFGPPRRIRDCVPHEPYLDAIIPWWIGALAWWLGCLCEFFPFRTHSIRFSLLRSFLVLPLLFKISLFE